MYHGVGDITPITTCPHCSILVNGSCEMCGPDDSHPSCESCVEGRIVVPWWQNELLVAIGTTVVVTVVSTIIITKIQRGMERRKTS